jgi:O-antigen biosynthesis protein
VIESMSRGVPVVLSPIAAEGTGLVHGHDALIARTAADWVDAVTRLQDEAEWSRLAGNALESARRLYGFDSGVQGLADALGQIGLDRPAQPALTYRHARPDSAAGASAAPAVLRQPA